jgi:hypothetical protein
MKLFTGAKVLVTREGWLNEDCVNMLMITKGSSAIIISFEEYQDWYKNAGVEKYYEFPPETVKQWIDEGTHYPVRFISIAPYVPNPIYNPEDFQIHCVIGIISVLAEEMMQVIQE